MKLFHRIMIGSREVQVYLPPSYGHSQNSYPVVYVQDGGFLFEGCIRYLEHLFLTGELCELILVGIETGNRNDEYTPWPSASLTGKTGGFGGSGKKYVDEVADAIKPYMDREYRTRAEAEHTAMVGGSLGGLISWFAGYWRPDVFGNLGILSASFWYEGAMEFIRGSEGLKTNLRVYMSVGGREGIYKDNAQKYMVENNKEVFAFMKEKGMPAERLTFVLDPEATHDDMFMMRRFPEALQRLFAQHIEVPAVITDYDRRYALPGTVVWRMTARNTGQEYRIMLSIPDSPPPREGYPVLYSLDANASFASLAESMRMQARGPHGIPPALIVGIGYDSPNPIVTEERFRDYTVYAAEDELPPRPGGTAWPENGGADRFLEFIETQLKPAVEREYLVDRSKQTLFGHSLGGFLTLYALFSQRGHFQRFAAASPSIWWKNGMLYKQWDEFKDRVSDLNPVPELSVTVGTEEKPSMVHDARELVSRIRMSGTPLKATLKEIEGEGHVSLLPSLISPLLRFVTK
ncbi:alpha/beta hydrolase [Paenibacillus sp. DYY-L-2]|uniref:alpha/beta hydrolase n=1 Tax=Paenibacillus sp. DYY-L-2 TaxID=3447013 RepID=UPI003F5050A9